MASPWKAVRPNSRPPGSSRIMRLHGAYISEQETAGLIRWLKKLRKPELDPDVLKASDEGEKGGGGGDDNDDDLYDEASKLVVQERQASASFLQRRMRVGFSRAARLIDMMERDGSRCPPSSRPGPAPGSAADTTRSPGIRRSNPCCGSCMGRNA
jgi:DNA segregation ATPase FtsK/SpoIIIE, S-DNA-T family